MQKTPAEMSIHFLSHFSSRCSVHVPCLFSPLRFCLFWLFHQRVFRLLSPLHHGEYTYVVSTTRSGGGPPRLRVPQSTSQSIDRPYQENEHAIMSRAHSRACPVRCSRATEKDGRRIHAQPAAYLSCTRQSATAHSQRKSIRIFCR